MNPLFGFLGNIQWNEIARTMTEKPPVAPRLLREGRGISRPRKYPSRQVGLVTCATCRAYEVQLQSVLTLFSELPSKTFIIQFSSSDIAFLTSLDWLTQSPLAARIPYDLIWKLISSSVAKLETELAFMSK